MAKIGEGHFEAWVRAGAKEGTQVLRAFPDATIQPVEEPGLFGNLTPQEIVNAKASIQARADQQVDRGSPGRESPGLER